MNCAASGSRCSATSAEAVELKHYQKKLAGLIRGNYAVTADDCENLHVIADSPSLSVTQEVILEWRMLSIENYCQLTAAALKQLDLFREATAEFVRIHGFSPYVEELGRAFLLAMEEHSIEVLATVAAFERAMIEVQQGVRDDVSVTWRGNPYEVLDALMAGSGLADFECGEEVYAVRIARDLPEVFEVTRVQ